METDDPFASFGGLGSNLGGNFGPRTAPFRSQSFNVGSNSGPRKDKQQDPPVEHDLYVTLDDISKVSLPLVNHWTSILTQMLLSSSKLNYLCLSVAIITKLITSNLDISFL